MDDLHKLLYNYRLKLDIVSRNSRGIQWNKFLSPKNFFFFFNSFDIFWELQK